MESLVFSDESEQVELEDAIAEVEDRQDEPEYTDKIYSILDDNFQPDCKVLARLKEWVEESYFLAMPYTKRSAFCGPSGTLKRCLTVIDYMNALNVSWDMQVKQKDLLTLVILKYLSISGVNNPPKMKTKSIKGINISKVTWVANKDFDNNNVGISKLYIDLFKASIFVEEEVIHAISDMVCKQNNHKLAFLLNTAEFYVDKFLK